MLVEQENVKYPNCAGFFRCLLLLFGMRWMAS